MLLATLRPHSRRSYGSADILKAAVLIGYIRASRHAEAGDRHAAIGSCDLCQTLPKRLSAAFVGAREIPCSLR